MTPREFVTAYYSFAMQSQVKTGLSAVAILAQAALESAWGNSAPGFMFFGVKDSDGLNGNEQLLLTTEYLDHPDQRFPFTKSVVQVGKKLWKYTVKDYFRKYASPEQCFTEHALFFSSRHIYAAAWAVRNNPDLFFNELQKAGYATSVDEKTGLPNYADTLKRVSKSIILILNQNNVTPV